MTLRPLGPKVTLTALASVSMPRSIRSRASVPSRISLAAMIIFPSARLGSSGGALDDAHDVGLLNNHQLFAIELDLVTRPFAKQHAVAALDVERMQLAILVAGARADGDDFAFHRFLLRRVGDEDAARGFYLGIDTTDQDAVLQWTQFHRWSPRTRICGRGWHCRNMSANAYFPTWGVSLRNTTINDPKIVN